MTLSALDAPADVRGHYGGDCKTAYTGLPSQRGLGACWTPVCGLAWMQYGMYIPCHADDLQNLATAAASCWN